MGKSGHDESDHAQSSAKSLKSRGALGSIPRLCKLLVVVAVATMAAGVALPMVTDSASSPSADSASVQTPADGLAMGLNPTSDPTSDDQPAADDPSDSPWSGAIFRLGFSFFAGFAIAFALRMIFRTAVLFIGLFLLMLMGLQYAGIIEVKWALIEQQYDSIAAFLSAQTETFSTFVTGYLPSTGSAAAGLAAGFLRRR